MRARRGSDRGWPHSFSHTVQLLTNVIYHFLLSRRVEIETKLVNDPSMSDESKRKQLAKLGKSESTFLRLRRTKIGLNDFRTVKLIGKGAFGEVRQNLLILYNSILIHHSSGSARSKD